MKKEIPTPILVAVGAVVLVIAIFLGLRYYNNNVNPQEDATLAQQQLEIERARRPKAVDPSAPAATTATEPVPQGMSPGRESEMNARTAGGR
jgi:hypothetical protein